MKYITLLLTILFLGACNKLELAMDFAPRLIANNLDDTFDFTSERYSRIKNSIEKDIQQNKNVAVDEVIKSLDQLLLMADKNKVTKADFENNIADLKVLQKRAVGLFSRSIEEVVNSLTKKEFDHMKEVSAERFAKSDERLLDPKKFKKHAVDRFENNMELFFDDVTDEQIKMYETFIDNNYEFYKLQIDFRKESIKKFELLLDNKEQLLDYTLKYYSGDDSVKPEIYVKKQKQFFDNANQLQVDIWNSTSADQKKEFKKTLIELKTEIQSLKRSNAHGCCEHQK